MAYLVTVAVKLFFNVKMFYDFTATLEYYMSCLKYPKGRSMRKIAVINQKGGSGKTTTSVNLAASLANLKKKVLLIDLDPQSSTTLWFDYDIAQKDLLTVFTENKSLLSIAKQTKQPNLTLVPSSTWLMGLEKALASEVCAEMILKQRLEDIEQDKFDYVFIDCPPTLGILAISALVACTEVLIPLEARVMALAGLVQLLQTIEIVKKRLNNELEIAGIVPCRVDLRTKHSKEIVNNVQEKFGKLVYKTYIRENIKLAEASSFGQPIMFYDKDSNGTADYDALAREVIKQEASVKAKSFTQGFKNPTHLDEISKTI